MKRKKEKRMKKFGEYLASLRKHKGENISVRDVSRATAISDPYLYQIEKGQKALTDPEYFNRIADYYDEPVEELLKKAGYIPETEEKRKIDKTFDHLISRPELELGTQLKNKKIDTDTKKAFIEVYQTASGDIILDFKNLNKKLKMKKDF